VLRAEGERISRILQAQGNAQALRILSVGSRPLDRKAITVLSLDTLKEMSSGQATKIIFPFEISGLIKQAAKFIGAEEEAPAERPEGVLPPEEILGTVPTYEEVRTILREMDTKIATEVSVDELKDIGKAKRRTAEEFTDEIEEGGG
jgi:hypothetical protein